jgi:hypothetical protein
MCSEVHLSTLVSAAIYYEHGRLQAPYIRDAGAPDLSDEEHTFQVLVAENVKSLVARYGDKELAEGGMADTKGYRYTPTALSAVTNGAWILRLISSYAYQSCEHDGWENSFAKEWVEGLKEAVITKLPGYDAKWAP